MRQVVFVTGNKYKFEVAQKALQGTDIELVQQKIETPEIQSKDVEEIAKYSAKYAAEKLTKPAIVTDAGWYIETLNGFPGPFIKYINEWLSSEDLLRLMKGKDNRKITVKVCLAYCEPGKESLTFSDTALGTIAQKAVESNKESNTSINKIFIPEGFDKVESEIPREEMVKFWAKAETHWKRLVEYIKNKS